MKRVLFVYVLGSGDPNTCSIYTLTRIDSPLVYRTRNARSHFPPAKNQPVSPGYRRATARNSQPPITIYSCNILEVLGVVFGSIWPTCV